MKNRVEDMIGQANKMLSHARVEDISKADERLALSPEEHREMRFTMARLRRDGRLSMAEGVLIHRALGQAFLADNGGWMLGTSTAAKYAVSYILAHLGRALSAAA